MLESSHEGSACSTGMMKAIPESLYSVDSPLLYYSKINRAAKLQQLSNF